MWRVYLFVNPVSRGNLVRLNGNYFCKISKKFAITYFLTSIIGRRITQKCRKCDWSVKRDLATKIVYIIPKIVT